MALRIIGVRRIGKKGASLATTIPKPIATAMGLKKGGLVGFAYGDDGRIVIFRPDGGPATRDQDVGFAFRLSRKVKRTRGPKNRNRGVRSRSH